MKALGKLPLAFFLAASLAAPLGALPGCKAASRDKGPKLLFAPETDRVRSFDVTITSSGHALEGKSRQPFESTLAMRVGQQVYPVEPDGLRLLRLKADKITVISEGQRAESTQTLEHQAKVDPYGAADPVVERTDSGRARPVSRQMTLETIFAYVQPSFVKGRPEPGMSWQATQTVPVPPGADMPFRFRYRVAASEKRAGRDLLRVDTSFAASGTAEKRDHYITTLVIGWQRGSGTIWVDPKDLQAVEASVTWESKVKRHTAGLENATFVRVSSKSRLAWSEARD